MEYSSLQIASEIYTELENPVSPTQLSIQYWLLANLGKLNNAISTQFTQQDNAFSSPLNDDQKDIFKSMYYQYYYNNKYRAVLIGVDNNGILSLKDDDSDVKFINKKDIAKMWLENSKEEENNWETLANLYKHNRSGPRDPDLSLSGYLWS